MIFYLSFLLVNVENSYAVYAFLVDSVGRVRWRAGGKPWRRAEPERGSRLHGPDRFPAL